MSAAIFIQRQIAQIQQGGYPVFLYKANRVFQIITLPLSILAVPAVLLIRLIRPWVLLRFGGLASSRIGHFAANTELYLCERAAGINVPAQRHVDLFYFEFLPICNRQLAIMWKRVFRVWPSLILAPIRRVNRLIPGWEVHEAGNNGALDIHNLLDRFPSHLKFTPDEEAKGEAGLRTMGIPHGTPFVCLLVRDSAYLDTHIPVDWSYHNYRDCSIQNFILAAEELAERGYFVIRMGAKVRDAIKTCHSRVIDYATNGMRSDFMDIYLGAKCEFCISTGTGWDAVPAFLFRRPVVVTNLLPLGNLASFSDKFLLTTKRHIDSTSNRDLTLSEIFSHGVSFCLSTSEYESKGIRLIENTPEEIREVALEMADRLNGTWQPHKDDEALQQRFWETFPTDAVDADQRHPLHGEIRARVGAAFLRHNRWCLQ